MSARFQSHLGSLFVLVGVACDLDGNTVFEREDQSGRLGRAGSFPTFSRPVDAGQHELVVRLRYRGDGFGPFQYLDRYTFTVRTGYTFPVEPGARSEIVVDAYDKGDKTLRLEDWPFIKFNTRVVSGQGMAIQEP